ncbi:biorientation of chromosomes in cell division protein 1-like 1 [Echeneis naucrates]|uniref:biorientation of chromosomes in cell division protein 1-like 1 n=1 Tax=Echeneis naucrates TaxID=173247 RepID=UPI0011134BE6|nr:biorientation of chromosomes in cell division protein 1-like 1 [Echeneis naucrates]
MAGLPPGDPQLVSMIVSHLKTQGLFDQFRRDCLADVDTKPAYLNLKQRVDNFVSNHLSNHTWSPHLNKNQLRNNIRQLVLQSGMLEQGVDRIVAQVVDPKINHIFRPQVERVVREFLSPGSCSEEPLAPLPPVEPRPDSSIPEPASSSAPSTTAASDAMSILDTITSLNQEASVRASSGTEKARKGQASDDPMQLVEENGQDMSVVEEGDSYNEGKMLEEVEETKVAPETHAFDIKTEDTQEEMDLGKEGLIEIVKMEDDDSGVQEQTEEEKDSRTTGKSSEEKQDDELLKSTNQAKQKARERIKEEYSLEDSDLEGLSDITVSSVHTSDLSSFEEGSEDDALLSDSSEEGELPPDDQGDAEEKKPSGDAGEEERKPRRKAYVHKPFLYSRYYSDSDDEITVEERRRSAAKDKEERLLKRQQNRERMEEKRKQKAIQAEEQDHKKQKSGDFVGLERPRAKEARKERKVLEKKMALNRKRKLDSRKEGDVACKKKGDTGGEGSKKVEVKSYKAPHPKLMRNLSESASSDERHRRTSGSVTEDSGESKKVSDKGRTHSFILELEQGSQEALKQRSAGKFDRLSRKELHSKERKEKERSLSDERAKVKQKQEKKSEHQGDESQQKEGVKVSSEEKGEKKPKIKSEKKMPGNTREGKASVSESVVDEGPKDGKKVKAPSTETVKVEKEKEKQKDKIREKEKEKDKSKEKEKIKGDKTSVKSDVKQLLRPDSAGSTEDRSEIEPGPDGSKKKDKHSKEVLKRSKSHSEDRQGEKPKSTTDGKDGEKEKIKVDQDCQKPSKSSSEPTDKDPKRVKTTEKGKIIEKSKSKSKEETKTPLSLKTEKKVLSSDVKSAVGTSLSKPEGTKERKKEGNTKDQRKVPEEPAQERSEIKSAKKKLEKKDKVPEKKEDDQEDGKASREDKLEKSEKSSVSSVNPETEVKKPSLLQDTSTNSDPVTTSFSDDTCDALSDITPEPPEGETESRLSEMPAVPAEADALLTLMDVCTSAEARLPPESIREELTAEMVLQEADMKMKEAALTLLSMDPDSTVSSSLISHNTSEEPEVNPAALQQMETTTTTEEEEQLPPMDAQPPAETDSTAAELSPALSQPTLEPTDEKPNCADELGNAEMEASRAEPSEIPAPQEDDTPPMEHQTAMNEDEADKAEITPETQPDEKVTSPAPDNEAVDVMGVTEEVRGSTEEMAVAVVSDGSEQDSEISSQRNECEQDIAETRTSPEVEKVAAEENQAVTDPEKSEAQEVDNVAAERSHPTTMETNVPEKTEEVRGSESECQSKLVKQISFPGNMSSTDSQEDEKESDLSEKEKKTDGRHKQKLTSQKVSAVKDSGDETDEKEQKKEQLSDEETEQENVVEVRTPRRGRSSRSAEEMEKDHPKEPEKSEETPSHRGRRSGAEPKEATADYLKKDEDEESADRTTSGKPAEKEEKIEDKSPPRESPVPPLTPIQEDSDGAGNMDNKETTDTRKPAVKRKRSEETDESIEQAQDDKEPMEEEEKEEMEEINKPSKPSTRASRQSGKEETAAGTRGARGQAAVAKGGRKREASPPAVRTRGGQKSEEPPSKRAKR